MDTFFIKFLLILIIGILISKSYNLRTRKEFYNDVNEEACSEDPELPGCQDMERPSKIKDLKVESGLNKLTLYWMAPEKGASTIKEYVIVYYERPGNSNDNQEYGNPHFLYYRNRGKTFCKYEILNDANNGPLLGEGNEYKIGIISVNKYGPQKDKPDFIDGIRFKPSGYRDPNEIGAEPNKEELIICQNDGTYNSYPNNDPNSPIDINNISCNNNIQAIGLQRHEQLVNLLKPNKKLNFNVNLSNLF